MKQFILTFLLAGTCLLTKQVQAQVCTVDAGAPVTMCSDQYSASLTGTANDNVTWTTSGTGYISDINSQVIDYYPSSADIAAGSVTLTLTNNATTCTGGSISDQVVLTINKAPSLTALTTEDELCYKEALENGIPLTAIVKDASSLNWTTSNGSGTFLNANSPATVYTPVSSDAGLYLNFTATATATNGCTVTRDVTVSIYITPTVTAMDDYAVCSSSLIYGASISCTHQGGNEFYWYTSSGGYFDSYWSDNTYYHPSEEELEAGKATVYAYVSDYYYGCGADIDTVVIILDKQPTVTGLEIYACSGTSSVTLHATTTNTTALTWSVVTGTGTLSDPNALSPVYTLGAGETTDATMQLRVETNALGECIAAVDDMYVYVTSDPPSVEAGEDFPVCALQSAKTTSAYGANAFNAYSWSSSGTGTWTKQNTLNDAVYTPSAADRLTTSTTLTLTATGLYCPSSTDQVLINHDPTIASVDAGTSAPYCFDSDITNILNLNGTVTGLTAYWSTLETYDNSIADASSASTTYEMGYWDGEYRSSLTFILSGTADICGFISDTATFIINKKPFLYGSDEYGYCKGDTIFLPTGGGGATSVAWTTSNGTGTFYLDGATDLYNSRYIAGPTDQAISFTATLPGEGACATQTQDFIANIHAYPTAQAGSDDQLCSVNTFTLAANTPTATGSSEYVDGSWYVGGEGSSEEARQEQVFGVIYFDDYTDPNTGATVYDAGAWPVVWRVRESWEDMPSEGFGGCIAEDTVMIIYSPIPILATDTLVAQAGLSSTKNVLDNDLADGYAYHMILSDSGYYVGTNVFTFDTLTGQLNYTNRTPFLNGLDILKYKVSFETCAIDTAEALILVKLVNGPPYQDITANASHSLQRAEGTILTYTVDMSVILKDYNENIDWNRIDLVSSTSDVSITQDIVDKNKVIFTYSSVYAQDFAGEDIIVLKIWDKAGAPGTVTYKMTVLPDYANPDLAPEDFVVINAVSPNGDGVNDYMHVHGVADYKTTVSIYTRWSEKVWEHEDYNNGSVRFEGERNINGSGQLPEGTYFYVIKNENKDQNGEKNGLYSGYLEIRR